MHWDWTINAGNVIAAVVLLSGFIVAHSQNIRKIQELITKVDLMYGWFRQHVIGSRTPE